MSHRIHDVPAAVVLYKILKTTCENLHLQYDQEIETHVLVQ